MSTLDIERRASASPTAATGGRRIRIHTASLGELAIYLGVALVIIWPVTPHLATRIVGSGDADAYVWINWRVADLIQSLRLFPTTIPDAVWPYGSSLLTSDGYLPVYAGALWNLILPPVLAYNVALLTASLLNMWAGRTLSLRFSDRRAVWIVTAVAFATAPAISMRIFGHYTFVWAFSVPILVAWGVDTARGTRRISPVKLGLLLYAAYLCSVFYLVFGAAAYVIIILLSRPRDARQLIVRIAGACAVTLVLMTPFLVERLSLDGEERDAGASSILADEAVSFSADLEAIVVQPSTSKYELPGLRGAQFAFGDNVVEGTIFPGYLLLFGFGALVVLRTRLRIALLVAASTMWLMTLGPSLRFHGGIVFADETGRAIRWLPFAALQSLPGLGQMRTPNRASFALAAILAAGLALGLDWFLGSLRTAAARAATIVVCALVLATNLVIPVNWSTLETSGVIEQGLHEIRDRAADDESVVFVPADCFDDLNNNGKLQIEFELPMLGCQANFASIAWYSGINDYVESLPLAGLRCAPTFLGRRPMPQPGDALIDRAGMVELHRRLGVRFYILDKVVTQDARCAGRIGGIAQAVAENAATVAEDDRWAIYDAFPPGS